MARCRWRRAGNEEVNCGVEGPVVGCWQVLGGGRSDGASRFQVCQEVLAREAYRQKTPGKDRVSRAATTSKKTEDLEDKRNPVEWERPRKNPSRGL